MSFSNLRKTSQDLDRLKQQIKGDTYEGEDTFVMGRDASNQGYARIRLLPGPKGIDTVSYMKFTFKRGSKVYNNLSRRSIGLSDPCQQYKSALWNAGLVEESRKISKKNITVMYCYCYEDKIKPENNGQLLKFYAPQHIRKMVENAIDPPEDKFAEVQPKPFNPFDIFGTTGRDLILRMVDKEGYPNYEQSKWADSPTPWFAEEDEERFEKLYNEKVKDLGELLKEERFKSEEQLLQELIDVVGIDDPIIRETFDEKIEQFGITSKTKSSSEPSRKKEEKKDEEKLKSFDESAKEKKQEKLKEDEEEKKYLKPDISDDDDDDEDEFEGFDFGGKN